MRDRARRHGGEAVRLIDGTVLVTFASAGGTAMEQASQAASCAHELRSMHPVAVVAVATGFAHTTERLPVGEVIDRAAALLSGHGESGTTMDGVTGSLVETRFEVRARRRAYASLGAPRRDDEEARTLLGKPTPCVGRDRELAMLESRLEQCIEERAPRAVLVTAPPGTGKSRLRQEFLARVREEEQRTRRRRAGRLHVGRLGVRSRPPDRPAHRGALALRPVGHAARHAEGAAPRANRREGGRAHRGVSL